MSPPLWPLFSWSRPQPRPTGPSPALFYAGMEASFLNEVNRALALTVQANAWPDTYGRQQPVVAIAPGFGVGTTFYPDVADPFRLSATERVKILVGDAFFETGMAKQLLAHGFLREQILVQILAHEAYHSNEGQHLQRNRVPLHLFDALFTSALREGFPDSIRDALITLSIETLPLVDALKNAHGNSSHAMALKPLHRLHTKINEGAADIYSLVVFNRIYPDAIADYSTTLEIIRRKNLIISEVSPVLDEQVYAYDNASCIASFLARPRASWPSTSSGCTVFSLRHAIPFLQQEPSFQTMLPLIDRMSQDLDRMVQAVTAQDLEHPDRFTGSALRDDPTVERRRHRR